MCMVKDEKEGEKANHQWPGNRSKPIALLLGSALIAVVGTKGKE